MTSGSPMPHPDLTPAFGDADADLQLRTRRSVGDDIYEVLLARLISLKIPPGARISIAKLAR